MVGIFIAGIVKANSMTSKSRLSAARTLTKSSPVLGIKDLELWLEPTLEESITFNSSGNVTKWNDLNSQNLAKKTVDATPSAFVGYVESGIGNLPSMYFNGSSAGFTIYNLPIHSADNTVFIVEMHPSTLGGASIIYGSDYSFNYLWEFGTQAVRHNNASVVFKHYSAIPPQKINIHSIVEDIDATVKYKTKYNRNEYSATTSISGTVIGDPRTDITVGYGGWGAITSYISEIIVYSRALKEEERQAVESYLMKKYGVM